MNRNNKILRNTLFIIFLIIIKIGYWLTAVLRPTGIILATPLDEKIPFIPFFVIFYIMYYPLIFIPIIVFWKKIKIINVFVSYNFALIITLCTYLIVQTTIIRPSNVPDTFFGNIVSFFYNIDPNLNLMPSIHVTLSMLAVYWLWESHIFIRLSNILLVVSICLSTLFIKQHMIIDVITGVILATIVFKFVHKRKFLDEKLLFKDKPGLLH